MTRVISSERSKNRNQIVTTALKLLCLMLLICASITTTRAQSETATISGLITDEGGGIVPNCEVVLHDVERGTITTAKTNDAGIYVFASVQPGQYNLTIKRNGFKQVDFLGLIANIQDHIEQNFRLQVGSVSESVTVEGNGLNINTTDAAVSTVIDRNFVESLPLNGRSFNTLLQLTPGVVIAPQSSTFGAAPGQFSIAGQRTDANSFTVDGVSANFGASAITATANQSGTGTAQAFSAFGGTSSLVSVDALQEFRIETSSFAPEFGRTPGGAVILTTRSGTNGFHGAVFDYFRNTVLDANDWFANLAGLPRAADHHNDFGGVFGGPIWKDKTFFFVSYEGARLDLPQSTDIQVPSLFARSAAPAALSPYLNAYPQPNGQPSSPTAYTAPFTGTYSNRGTLDAGSIRIDHRFNDQFSVFGRYNDAPSELASRPLPASSVVDTTSANTRTLTFGVNMLLTSRLANTIRANYSTQNVSSIYSLDTFGGAVPLNPSLLLTSLDPSQNQGSLFFFDLSQELAIGPVAKAKTTQFNAVDDLSVTFGPHEMKFGGDYRAIFLDTAPPLNNVSLTSVGTPTFLSSGAVDFYNVTAYRKGQLLTQAFSLYAQDTWRIKPRLTITYGLRWELSPAPSPRNATTLAAWTNVTTPSQIALAPAGTPPWRTTYGNFAPRGGLAYNLTSKGDLVLRAGAGTFYDLGVGSAANLTSTFPNTALGPTFTAVAVPVTNLTPFLPSFSLQPPFPNGVQAFAPNLKLPRSYQWNVALEKSFGTKQAVSVTYVGQAGRDLFRQEALSQPNMNFSGVFELTQNNARSNYNALQLQYRRPLSARFQGLFNYTLSHSLDNSSNDVISGISNTIISAANDYASSDFDVRQSFSAAVTYDIPGLGNRGFLSVLTNGWSVDTVIVARTGFPFNASIFAASALGVSNTRPDLVTGQALYLYGTQCLQAPPLGFGQLCPGGKGLNPSAFSIPSTVRQGNEGRNDIRGFGLTQVDLSLCRKFAVTERFNVQFRADAFNVLNHPNFANPIGNLDFGSAGLLSTQMLNQGLGGLNPLFQEGGPRSLQLSLRLAF